MHIKKKQPFRTGAGEPHEKKQPRKLGLEPRKLRGSRGGRKNEGLLGERYGQGCPRGRFRGFF